MQIGLCWNEGDLAVLDPTMATLRSGNHRAAVTMVCDPGSLEMKEECKTLLNLVPDLQLAPQPLLVSLISMSLNNVETNDASPKLTEIPAEAPEALKELLKEIVEFPERPWSLKEAAAKASYSAFYLSRMFRTISSYGFPEYVDRARTQKAIKMLLESNLSIPEIIETCGFSSLQRFRNACRDYSGFLPSELQRFARN